MYVLGRVYLVLLRSEACRLCRSRCGSALSSSAGTAPELTTHFAVEENKVVVSVPVQRPVISNRTVEDLWIVPGLVRESTLPSVMKIVGCRKEATASAP